MRFYISNESYPELREIRSRWDRHRVWWRAFASALGDRRFWRFIVVQMLLLGGWIVVDRVAARPIVVPSEPAWAVHAAVAAAALTTWGVLALSWGGDLVRPHLRRVSSIARAACPGCGHQLTGHLDAAGAVVRCPECGAGSPRGLFDEPYAIPRVFLAFGRRTPSD